MAFGVTSTSDRLPASTCNVDSNDLDSNQSRGNHDVDFGSDRGLLITRTVALVSRYVSCVDDSASALSLFN